MSVPLENEVKEIERFETSQWPLIQVDHFSQVHARDAYAPSRTLINLQTPKLVLWPGDDELSPRGPYRYVMVFVTRISIPNSAYVLPYTIERIVCGYRPSLAEQKGVHEEDLKVPAQTFKTMLQTLRWVVEAVNNHWFSPSELLLREIEQ